METTHNKSITVETNIDAAADKVWSYWTTPYHIKQWCQASDDWYAPYSENDLRVNGKFRTTMSARDDSEKFDFEGTYTEVDLNEFLAFTLTDGRKVNVTFKPDGDRTRVVETFEPENLNSLELQRDGWQAILDNFRKYVESAHTKEKVHFDITIGAKPEKVYRVMLDDKGFREWTSPFAPNSRFEGSWDKGSKIRFLGENEKGEEGGMVSRIAENIPNRFVSIEHIGIIKGGEEIMSGKEVEEWANSYENYTFKSQNGKTELSVDVDIQHEYKVMFEDMWLKALKVLKEMCEK